MIRTAILMSVMFASRAVAGLEWSKLPDIPDAHGFAGAFAGVASDALIVAGGANFPEGTPWDGGAKVWHDRVFVHRAGEEGWVEAGRLERPLGYGVSISTPDGVFCAGGSDATKHHAEAFLLSLDGARIATRPMAPLPVPLANMAGARVGGRIHVIGGTTRPDAITASNRHFAFDGSDWTELPPLPAEGRILPVAGSRDGAFFVFSGAALNPGAGGEVVRSYLRDAWRYDKSGSWKRLADLPRAAVAAPSPAPATGASHLLVIGGDDGRLVSFEPKSEHPGFPRDIVGYDTVTDTWAVLGSVSEGIPAVVTAPVVVWQGRDWVVSGEVRPAVRTPAVSGIVAKPVKTAFGALNWTVVVVYLAAMIGIGVWFMKREAASTTEAYFRGGQRVPAWVAGLSIFATMLSALTFMGIPARAYRTDISWYLGQLPILLIVPLVAACYLPFFRKLDLTSAYEYLERRFSLACRLFASLSFTAFHLGRIAIVLYLPALALATVSDIDVITAILVIGLLCLVYTVIGGIEAVVWTDAVQALVLMAGALLCFVLAAWQVEGGIVGLANVAARDHKLFESLRWDSFDTGDGTTSALVLFTAFFFNSLVPYTSSQDVVQRYVTTRDIDAARRSLRLTMWMSVSGGLLFFLLGTAVYAFYKTHPERLDPSLASGDSILPFFIFHELPAGVSGLIIAAIFAAAQSTVSSSLNSVATTFVKDIDSRLLRPGRVDRTYLRSAQAVVVVTGLAGTGIAVVMARSNIESAFATFNTMIGLTAGSLGGVFALGVFTRRTHGKGALAGAIAGIAVVLALYLTKAPVTGLLYAAIGFGTCFVTGVIVSRCLPGRGDPSLSLPGET
jgi:SSS family transporter